LSKKLEIKLNEVNNETVNLDSMSPEMLDSFMTVMGALKALATTVIGTSDLKFSISKGSALGAVIAPNEPMEKLYSKIDSAIEGNSSDKELTSQLRIIQNQVKRDNYKYSFNYLSNSKFTEIHNRLKNCKTITLKRKTNSPFKYKLKIIQGFFNQIGGKTPNYHFDYGGNDKLIVNCSVEQARTINKYIYSNINSLLLCKEWNRKSKKDEYYHKVILDDSFVQDFKDYIRGYNSEDKLLEKLTLTHDFVDTQFEKKPNFSILRALLIAFNDENFHLSELKTLLVISKPFKTHEIIKHARESLLETYLEKRNS